MHIFSVFFGFTVGNMCLGAGPINKRYLEHYVGKRTKAPQVTTYIAETKQKPIIFLISPFPEHPHFGFHFTNKLLVLFPLQPPLIVQSLADVVMLVVSS